MAALSAPAPPPITFIPCEEHFRPVLPTIEGNVDYLELRGQLGVFDELLRTSGLEQDFIRRSLAHWVERLHAAKLEAVALPGEAKAAAIGLEELTRGHQQVRFQEHSSRALRCTLARTLLGGSLRDFAARLADSPLLQWFCRVGELDRVQVPAKSTLQRYATWLPEEEMRGLIAGLLRQAGAPPVAGLQPLELDEPLDFSALFLDTTCLKANIHFPVDWVLLRDGVISLMQSVELIRRHGREDAHGRAEELHQRNQPALHGDDAHPAQKGRQKGTQTGAAADEKTSRPGARPCGALPDAARGAVGGHRLDAPPSRAGPAAHRRGGGDAARSGQTGARTPHRRASRGQRGKDPEPLRARSARLAHPPNPRYSPPPPR